jgi:hypothetical protein
MAKIPVVIEVDEPSPFGEEVDPELTENPERDYFYIKGYSDLRQARDLAIARGETPKPLPFRLQAVRAQTARGAPDGQKVAEWKARGYRVLTYETARELGLDLDDSAAQRGESDSVTIGDSVIMVADAKTAATHYRRNRDLIESQRERYVEAPLRNAVERYNQRAGRAALSRGATEAEFEVELQGDAAKKGKKK